MRVSRARRESIHYDTVRRCKRVAAQYATDTQRRGDGARFVRDETVSVRLSVSTIREPKKTWREKSRVSIESRHDAPVRWDTEDIPVGRLRPLSSPHRCIAGRLRFVDILTTFPSLFPLFPPRLFRASCSFSACALPRPGRGTPLAPFRASTVTAHARKHSDDPPKVSPVRILSRI